MLKVYFLAGSVVVASSISISAQTVQRMEIALAGTEIVRTQQPINTVAVGDPGIADVSLINETLILVTGKKIGTTGLVLLDRTGNEILRRTLRVGAEQKPVRVLDGTPAGTAYVCAPLCTPAQGPENLLARNLNEDRQSAGGQGAPGGTPASQ
jgi:hypothetical protein